MGARLLMSPADADATVAAFTSTMPPGSYLILSAGTSTNISPALVDRLRSADAANQRYHRAHGAGDRGVVHRAGPRAPGLVDVQAWRPGCQIRRPAADARRGNCW